MKNILIITENFLFGGLETRILGQIEFLNKKGYNVYLAAINVDDRMLQKAKIKFFLKLDKLNMYSTVQDLYFNIEILKEFITANNIDIVDAHPLITFIPSLIAAKLCNVKYIANIHGPYFFNFQDYGDFCKLFFQEILLKNSDILICVSEEVASLCSIYNKNNNIEIIRNGININYYNKCNIDFNKPCAIISRIDSSKLQGIKEFIKMAHEIGIKEIHIFGDGPNRQELLEFANNYNDVQKIIFKGVNYEIYKAIRDNYSIIAGMGRVILESSAMNLPTILVGYDGVKGFVDNEILEKAKWWNYSGRGISNISVNELKLQFEYYKNNKNINTRDWVLEYANEEIIWNQYINIVESIKTNDHNEIFTIYNLIKANLCNYNNFVNNNMLYDSFERIIIINNKNKFEILNNKLNEKISEIYLKDNDINNLKNELNNKINELNQAKFQLDLIYKSDFWKLALKYYRIRDNIWPLNSLYKMFKNLRLKNKNGCIDNIIQENSNKDNIKIENDFNDESMILNFNMPKQYMKYDIMFFSVIDWHFRYQRPQHIAYHMAEEGHRVFYFDANFDSKNLHITDVNEQLQVIKLSNNLGTRIYDIDFNLDIENYKKQIDEIITKNCIRDCIIFVEYPTWQPIIYYLKQKYNFKVVFDYLDDYTGFNTTNNILLSSFDSLINESDLIIASSMYLYEKVKNLSNNVVLIRNGTEFEHFNKVAKEVQLEEKERPVVGYYGAIAEWFDMDKIIMLAKNRKEYDIVLIGDTTYADINEASKYNNIKLLGEKNYMELPQYLKKFDVCLIPFKTDLELIKATNPVKFYEYLSAGKKIVATEIQELEEFKNKYVYLTNDDEMFLKYVDQCINNTDILVSKEQKIEFAKKHDWKERINDIKKAIKAIYPLVSIVIVTYNNLYYTKKCIKSIIEKTAYPNFEIIIVDNNSTDNTQIYLKQIKDKYNNIKVIFNNENNGFAKGNNIGIREAKGQYIILLNNDTIVTRGWITNLVKHLEINKKLGMLCPVTNSIGNEAKINVDYNNIEELEYFSEIYTRKHFNELYMNINVLAMFCVIIRKEVIDKVGLLDENFGIGMFEDDDYSYRVKENGFEIACAEDVFVHHFGGTSFSKIENNEYRKLFEKNKELFEKKWNTKWIPHKYRDGIN